MANVGDNLSNRGTRASSQTSNRSEPEPNIASDTGPPPKPVYVVVFKLNYKYMKNVSGILKALQVVCVLIALIFLTTAETIYAGYLLLPLDWHLRVFVFTTVFSMLYSLASYIAHAYRVVESLRFPWKKFNFAMECLLCFLLLFSSSLIASTIGYYDKLSKEYISGSTKRHLVIAAIFGYISVGFYAAGAYYAGKQLHGFFSQFTPQRFSTSQGSTSQPTTPTTESGGISMDNIIV